MKVNIGGKGSIPGIGVLAPAYGIDMSKQAVRRLLNFHAFRVFQASTGLIITVSNIDTIFASENKPAPKPVVKNESVKTKHQPAVTVTEVPDKIGEDLVENLNTVIETPVPVVDEIVPDNTEEEVAQDFIEDVSAVEDQLPDTIESEDEVVEVEENTDEVEDEAPVEENTTENTTNNNQFRPNKKKRRHH